MPIPSTDILSTRNLSRFRRLEMVARSVVEGFMTGLHKSPYKGFAIEFEEHRQYAPGDDLKHLDWKVLGKLDRYYIKQYEEDTSLRAYLALDTSGSMDYGSGQYRKIDYGRFICGVLSYLLLQQQDAVGLLTFDNAIRSFAPPRSSQKQLKLILDTLSSSTPQDDTGLGDALHVLANRIQRRGLIVIVSDFFDDINDIVRALNHFAHKKHEVIVFQVLDRKEADFPFTAITRFESLEDDSVHLVDPIRLRNEYRSQFEAHQMALRKACHGLRIDFVQMFTDEPFERAVAHYLSRRLRQ